MQSALTIEAACDVCHQKVAGGLRSWRCRLPAYDTIGVCASCSYRLTRTADGRGREEEDMMDMASVYRTLAGEVWSDADKIYWFRQPFVHRKAAKLADVLDRERLDTVNLADLRQASAPKRRAK